MRRSGPLGLPSAVWWSAWTFVGLVGFSRVSFGLLLPFVKHDFPGTYSLYGLVAAANFAGYLVALIAMMFVPPAWQRRRVNTVALVFIALTLAASGLAPELRSLAAARFVNGLAQGVATMLTIGLALSVVPPALRGRASGILWGGGGVGIALSGAVLPIAAAHAGGWRVIWVAMAVVAAIGIVGLHRALPERTVTQATAASTRSDRVALVILAAQYTLFGLAFASYFTYAPAYAHALLASALALAIAWVLLGCASAVGSDLWGRALDRSRRGATLALCMALGGVGALSLVWGGLVGAIVSAVLVGSSSVGGPAQTSALTRRYAGANEYVRALSVITTSFAVGQTLGAPVGGVIADASGLAGAIVFSAAIFFAGALAAWPIVTRARRAAASV
ncbi:MAG TPA: YbfB/YjiJ family MFS transporter [Candidatus Sulfotelmatobacter sp.]|nr:YbfB/YjiJ family MFS transporter [Candidatus Sulfotelmatobacter sp.]